MSEKSVHCSVVIPTYNRGENLEVCLRSVFQQSTNDFEVIVVDDCSSIDSQPIVERCAAANPQVAFLFIRREKNGGHGAARNTGVSKARGEIILFTDDDCSVPENWVEKHSDAHRRYPEAAGVGGWYWSPKSDEKKNVFERFFELQHEQTFPDTREIELHTNTMHSPSGNTANMSYKTDAYKELGGFDEAIYFTGGIDWELKARCIARGFSMVSIPLAVTHERAFTLLSFFSKAVKLGRGVDYMASKYPGLWRPSLYTAFGKYAAWHMHPTIRGEGAYIAFAWVVALTLGKWFNRLVRYRPSEVIHMRSEHYFTHRFREGKQTSSYEILTFRPQLEHVDVRGDDWQGSTRIRYSIIIPTYNRRQYVVNAVQAVLRQKHIHPDAYEIIVVDDGSTDGTKDEITAIQSTCPERLLRYIYQENRGAAHARNSGAAHAKGDIFFFTDSDCTVSPVWLRNMVQAYRTHPDIVGTGGGMLTLRSDATLFDTFRNTASDNRFVARYRYSLVKSNDVTQTLTPFDSASMSVRAEVFRRVGGFVPIGQPGIGFYHEDVDFVCRVQREGPMALVPQAYARNERLLSFREFCAVAYLRGVTLPFLVERIAPYAVSLREAPVRMAVVARFFQCLLRPFSRFEWVGFINMLRYASGYRKAMRLHIPSQTT